MNGYYQFVKRFYGPGDKPTNFRKEVNKTLGHRTPVWLDNIIIVNRGTKEKHTRRLYSVLTKLQGLARKKANFYQKKTIWLGDTISQDKIRRNKEKTEAINELDPPTNTKTLESFFSSIHNIAQFIPNLS